MKISEAIKQKLKGMGITIGRIRGEDCSQMNIFDLCVRNLMAMISPRHCFFIQIGANDGVKNDPIHHYIVSNKWEGILLEPQPHIFEKLKKNYQAYTNRLNFENAALGKTSGQVKLYYVKESDDLPDWIGGIASFSHAHIKKHLNSLGKNPSEFLVEMNVPCLTVTDLMTKYKLHNLDLLQIDAEGFDFEIIKLFFEADILPALINFEHVHLKRLDRVECFNFLAQHKYGLFSSMIGNTVAYREKL